MIAIKIKHRKFFNTLLLNGQIRNYPRLKPIIIFFPNDFVKHYYLKKKKINREGIKLKATNL